jgi:hypothetical protein
MDYSIRINLTEKQHHVLSTIAKDDYRTIENLFAKYAAVGFGVLICDEDVWVKKQEGTEEYDSEGPEFQRYSDKELEELIDGIPFEQN